MKKLIFAIIAFCFCWSLSLAAEVDFPPLSGQVIDEAGVLSAQTKAQLNALLSSDKDNQIVVAVLKNLRGKDGREYGVELARYWQLGQKGKDNGVLIFAATEDRYAGIEVGYGLEDVLTDSISGRILQNVILPPLKEKTPDYNQAMLNGAAAVMSIISNGGQVDADNMSLDDLWSLIFTLLMIYLILSGKGPRGGRGIFLGGGRGLGGGGGFFGGGGSFGGGGAGRRF